MADEDPVNYEAIAMVNMPSSWLRFLHTGHLTNSIPFRRPLLVGQATMRLAFVLRLADEHPDLPIDSIRKVYRSKLYTRVDDVLIALAYCARQTSNVRLRTKAYREAGNLIDNQKDFLMFVYFCMSISQSMHGRGRLSYGHGLRGTVTKWYGKFDALQLADMFGEHRSIDKTTHLSVIQRAHHRTGRAAPRPVPAAPAAASGNNNPPTSDAAEASSATIAPSTSNASEPSSATIAPSTSNASEPSSVRIAPSTSNASEPSSATIAPSTSNAAEALSVTIAPSTSNASEPSSATIAPSTSNASEPSSAMTASSAANAAEPSSVTIAPSTSSAAELSSAMAALSTSDVAEPSPEVSSTSGPSPDPEPPADAANEELGDDRELVFEYIFCKNTFKYLEYLADKPEVGEGAQRLRDLLILKTNEHTPSAVASIREHKFRVQQLPSHLLERQEVWEALLPHMSYNDMFDYFHTIRDFGFLNPGIPLASQLIDEFSDNERMRTEKICPFRLYCSKRLYDARVRYLSTRKAEYYSKKIAKRTLLQNSDICDHLTVLLDRAILNAEPIGAKYFITVDLRTGNEKRTVLSNNHVSCLAASVILMYSILMREKDTMVYTFSDTENELKQITDEIPRSGFDDALAHCDQASVRKTFQDLRYPLIEATAQKMHVDVFVVIVDSIARFARQGVIPVEEFVAYKANFNKNAKYVVVNLARATPDLNIERNNDTDGFFEVCGFSDNIPKILDALGKNGFS